MSTIAVFALAGAGTYLLRASMVLVGDRATFGSWLEHRLALVGPAVLGGLLTAAVATSGGAVTRPDPATLIAVVAALVVVRRTGNLGHALFVGLPVYWGCALVGFA